MLLSPLTIPHRHTNFIHGSRVKPALGPWLPFSCESPSFAVWLEWFVAPQFDIRHSKFGIALIRKSKFDIRK